MNETFCRIIRKSSRPQLPIPTGERPQLHFLEGIRAVFFDIYGTLFTSCSGEIGAYCGNERADQRSEEGQSSFPYGLAAAIGESFYESYADDIKLLARVFSQLAITDCHKDPDYEKLGKGLMSRFEDSIRETHAERRLEGVPWPEIDVREIWKNILGAVFEEIATADILSKVDCWAVEYEVKTNPVWPMPEATNCIDRLATANFALGIISNAQFYTPLLFPALMERELKELAISEEMQYYSYRSGRSKPDPFMFWEAQKSLAARGISASQTLYVGNDMLNDIKPAAQVGFRTALFAADQRSLRLRYGDSRVDEVVPDIVVTNLEEVVDCVLKR